MLVASKTMNSPKMGGKMREGTTDGCAADVGKPPAANGVVDGAELRPGVVRTPSTEELEFFQRQSQILEKSTPEEIISWAVEEYFPKLTMATAFGPEGCVILSILAKVQPRVYVFNLDTGYQFKETLELRDRITERYGIRVELRQAETSVAEYEAKNGGPVYKAEPDRCCHERKVVVLHRAVRGFEGLDERDSAGPEPPPGGSADRRLGQEIRIGEDQPPGKLDEKGRVEPYRRGENSL